MVKCLICKNETKPLNENRYFPFCSGKCKEIDLYNWLNERYGIMVEQEELLVEELPIESEEYLK